MNAKYVFWVLYGFSITVFAATDTPRIDHVLYKGGYEALGWEIKYGFNSSLAYRFSGLERVGLRDKQKEFTHSITRFDNRSLSALLDWHPMQNSFRASVGLFATSHRLEYFIEPTVNLQFDGAVIRVDKSRLPDEILFQDRVIDLSEYGIDKKITIEGKTIRGYKESIPGWIIIDPYTFQLHREDIHVTASANFKPLASYYGIGWGNRPFSNSRLRYSIDVGVIYLGKPEVSLTVSGDIFNDLDPRLMRELNEYVAGEERKLQRKAENSRLLPYLSIGLSLSF